ncbi:MAG: hypothetical protein ACK56J_10550 [Planctomycetota bacterium]|jgi:hypothetical protein|nr:hypothetical protein [Blastopirellula sp.]
MKIEPLCHELIAKLEIAIAHRNRERAIAVIERHFEAIDEPKVEGLNTPLSSVLPQRVASLLEREGFLYLGDFEGMEDAELSVIKGVGPKVIELLRSALKHPLSRSAESSKPRCLH